MRGWSEGLTLSPRELLAAADDPRVVVLDVRTSAERSVRPLDNPFFAVVYAPRDALRGRLAAVAALVGNRHVVVVDTDEREAVAAVRLLRTLEVDCFALQGGIAWWPGPFGKLRVT